MPITMSRQESLELKGVAILLMLFLHLFNHESEVALCSNFLYINGTPLVHLMTRMANPVPFFVILSGYGLYAAWQKGDKHRWARLVHLILHYWLILLVFVTIGVFLVPTKYPGTIWKVIENLTAFNTTYNGEHWFLFPYILLAISAPWLFRLCNKYKTLIVLGISYMIYLVTCFLISRYGDAYLYTHMMAYHPILYGNLLFNFLLGALAYRHNWLKILSCGNFYKWVWLLLLLLCVTRCCLKTGAFHNLYVFAFMWLWLQIERPIWLNRFLAHMGKHSMNIWLIHSFFCYYIFHDWIYSFRYPLLIYVVLLLVSYLSSHIINWMYVMGENIVSVYKKRNRIKNSSIYERTRRIK